MDRNRRYAANTSVSTDKSKAELEQILHRYGASEYGYMRREDLVIIGFSFGGKQVRFEIPLPSKNEFNVTSRGRRRRTGTSASTGYEKEIRRRWRALCLLVKAKLEATEGNVQAFEREFMPYMVLPGGRTVYEEAMPMVERAYLEGKVRPLLSSDKG